jgi:hypothetical protein
MEHTTDFYEWVFEHFGDSDVGNWAHRSLQSEYGISCYEMLDDHFTEAIEDAKDYVKRHPDDGYLIEGYKQNLKYRIEAAQRELDHYNKGN